LGVIGKVFPGVQTVFDKATGIVSTFSINIGVIYTCINKRFCSENNQVINIPFVELPKERHISMFTYGLSCLSIAFL
jgi:hypothetical protein